ncbi:hypothetical protein [Parvimonas sp. C2]|uniref:hypothetical protein n=1 Tax=Parvimonas sp. C2 TaxID=3110692 RepID=UPI002B464B54|nr:hypothetical protein [Parvimonas sp. C2]MEB3072832.1 hypothetical protein [Parvimonas sp. C2]
MEYQEYKKKYENMKIKYRKLYEEIGEGKEKEKEKEIYEQETKDRLELVKNMEENNDYNRTGELYRFYINLIYDEFYHRFCKDMNWRLTRKVLYHIDEYLKKDFYNLEMYLTYLTVADLSYFYSVECEKYKEWAKDSVLKNYANLYLAMEAEHFFCEGIIEEEELQKLETYKERYIADYGDKIYDKVYEATKREIEERNLRRDW